MFLQLRQVSNYAHCYENPHDVIAINKLRYISLGPTWNEKKQWISYEDFKTEICCLLIDLYIMYTLVMCLLFSIKNLLTTYIKFEENCNSQFG